MRTQPIFTKDTGISRYLFQAGDPYPITDPFTNDQYVDLQCLWFKNL